MFAAPQAMKNATNVLEIVDVWIRDERLLLLRAHDETGVVHDREYNRTREDAAGDLPLGVARGPMA
jgi:hypothetical protein